MSLFTDDFDNLVEDQTEALGGAVTATVTGYGTNVACVLSTVTSDNVLIEGGTAEAGTYEIQVKASLLSGEPPKQTAVTCGGAATGKTLEVESVSLAGGIYTIRLIDYANQ